MSTSQKIERGRPPRGARRLGYAIAIGVQTALLIVVNNLVEWDLLPFITEEFNELVPYINVSLVAGMAVNAMCIVFDPRWFRSLTQVVLNVISLVVIVQTYRIFPFDFSAYDFRWDTAAKALLVIGIVGSVIGIVVEFSKLARAVATP